MGKNEQNSSSLGKRKNGAKRNKLYRRSLLKSTAVGAGLFGLSGTATSQVDSGFLDILSADPSQYPSILLNVSVDTEAGRDGRLTREDFRISENGVEQAIQNFSFTSTTADIVFVFDDTGSMGGEIADMKAGVKDLTDGIEEAGIDARYSLISFKDDIETDLELTDDATQLKSAVDELSAVGGGDGPEDNFDALIRSLSLDYRSGAQKIVVDITDSVSHYRGDGSGFSEYTIDEVASRLQTSGVAYIAVAPNPDDFPSGIDDKFLEPQRSKKNLAEMIGGLWINIQGADFSRILTRIKRLVTTAYVLEYLTNTPVGGSREVGVEVNDPEEGTGRDTGSVNISSDTGPGPELIGISNEKLTLAEEITNLAESIDEVPRVESTLTQLQNRVASGEIGGGDAFRAVERMKLAENVTEFTLAGLGPNEARVMSEIPPESRDSLVGVPMGSPVAEADVSLAGYFVENVFWLGLTVLLIILVIKGVIGALVAGAAAIGAKGLSKFYKAEEKIYSSIPIDNSILKNTVEEVKDSVVRQISGGVITDGGELIDVAANLFAEVKESVAENIVRYELENSGGFGVVDTGTGINEKLTELDNALNITAEDGLRGVQAEARSTEDTVLSPGSEEGSETLYDVIDNTKNEFEEAELTAFLAKIAGTIIEVLGEAGGSLFAKISSVAGSLGLFAVGAIEGFSLLKITGPALYDARGAHNQAIDDIIAGAPTSGSE